MIAGLCFGGVVTNMAIGNYSTATWASVALAGWVQIVFIKGKSWQ